MRLAFTFVFLLTLSFSLSAQIASGLKGPKAKNYKPWKDDVKKETIVLVDNDTSLKGPAAKNRKSWETQTSEKTYVVQIKLGSNKRFLKGPAAKNYKPWKRKE